MTGALYRPVPTVSPQAVSVLKGVDLKVSYRGNTAVDVPLLEVRQGELVGVVGANGAGKSTLVNAFLGWSRGPAKVSGKVLLDGKDISTLPVHERIRAGLLLMPEGRALFSRMTVEENLQPLANMPKDSARRPYSVEDVFELFPRLRERRHHLGSQLSGGERQMLALGRTLRLGPKALLLDEPSIGLAPRLVSAFLTNVRALVDRGLSVLLVEQNVRASIEVVDRLVLLERGKIVAAGSASEMRHDPRIAEAYLGKLAPVMSTPVS